MGILPNKIVTCIKQIGAFLLSMEALTVCFFLAFSTIIWYGRARNTLRDTYMYIPIEYIGISENIEFSTPLPTTIRVTLHDAGKRLAEYPHISPSTLTIDLSSRLKGNKGSLDFALDFLRPQISDLLQGTTRLQQLYPEEIHSQYYKQANKQVPVVLDSEITTAKQYQLRGDVKIEPEYVSIYGEKKRIDSIEKVVAKTSNKLKNLKEDVTTSIAIETIEGVRMSCDSARIQVHIEQFTDKRLIVPVYVAHVPDGQKVRIFPTKIEVMARVGVSHFGDINESDIKAWCEYPKHQSERLKIEIKHKNPYITSYRINPNEVEFLIEQK